MAGCRGNVMGMQS